MKKFQRFLSFLLAALVIMTGFPIGSYAGESQAKSFHQGVFLAQGTRGSLPSLMELLGTQQNEERTSPPVRRSETHVSSPDIESTSAPAQESEEDRDSWDFFDRVGQEMEKNAPDGAEALPVRRLLVNDKKALSSLSYQIHTDDDGLPQSVTWILTYYVPQEKEIHQAAVVTNGDGLDQPHIYNREYAEGEQEVMEAREKDRTDRLSKGESAPVFLYDTETKAVNRDGYALTTITTPIHRDNDLLKKIQEAKSGEEVDREKMEEVKRTLEEKVYSLTLVSLFGEEKITQSVQVQGDGTWVETDPLTTPIRSEWTGEEEKENRLLFAVPNMDKEEKAYVTPSFPTSAQAGDDTRILVYDLVPGDDGFYDFRLVDQRSLDHYEKTLKDIQEEGLEGDALQEALDAATLKLEPGQFVVTIRRTMEKLEPVEEGPETSERPESSSTGEENPSDSTKPPEPGTENRPEKPETPSLNESIREAEEARKSAEQTLDLLSLGRTLKEDRATLDELMQGSFGNLLQPMGSPLNPFAANRPIIIEVVDRDNKGVKIPGAVVRITGPGMVKEVTTGPDGRAVLENCNAGDYEVVQVSAPKGYMANQKKIAFRFSAIETVKYVRIDDAKDYGTELYFIEGNVSDEKNHDLTIAGVELELRAYENNHGVKGDQVDSMTRTAYSDANGYFVFNDLLPQYIYEVAIMKAPYEYAFVESTEPSVENGRVYTDIKFQDENGQPIKINNGVKYKETLNVYLSKNSPNKAITITVYNHEQGDQQVSIVGSAFQILDERGEVIKDIGTLRTDGQGKITFKLRPGKYTIEQLTTDANHLIPNAQTAIEVQPLPHDTTQDIYLIPNPLKYIGSVTYTMDAVVNWGNVTPDPDAKIILKKNGLETDLTPEKIGQIYRFSNLPKYDDNHEQVDYRIELKDHPEYYATYRIVNGVVNIDVHEISTPEGPGGTVTVTGNKIWYNDSQDLLKRPATVHVVLLADGQETQYRAAVSEATDWKYSFTNLPRFNKEGKEIEYTVKEVQMSAGGALAGYRMDQTILGKNVLNTRIDHSKIGGEFSLVKMDDNKKPLEGAQFTLSGTLDNGQALKPERSLKTDAEGKLTFKDIPAGTYTLKETQAPDRYEPSTETWKVEVSSDGRTILVGSGVTNPSNADYPEKLQTGQEFVKDGEGSGDRTMTNEKARNPLPYRKTIYDQAGTKEVGDISKRILNTVDKNLNEYQVELTVQGRGQSSFAGGKETDIVLVVDHSGSIKTSRNEDQVRSQVRNIVSAFSGFSNVNIGYVEYAGITVEKNKNASLRDNNFSDYRWWNPYESNATYTNDPAVTSSVELTSPGQLAADPKFNTNRFMGGTFTQRALLRAQEILAKGKGENKHIILITDGGPTLSFKATGSMPNGTRPDGTAWEPIYKPNPTIPNTYSDVPKSGLTYNGRASGFDYNTLRGDGTYYQFGTSKGDTNQLAYSSYWAGNDQVLDSVYATISTVRDLTDAGIKVTTIGYNLKTLNNAGWFNGQEKFFFPMMASTPKSYSGLSDIGNADNAVTSIYDEVSKQFYLNSQNKMTPTIEKAVVTDPMGDGVDLYLGEDGVFNEKDYVLVASDGSIYKNGKAPAEGLLKNVKLTYDATNRQFKMEGLILGKDESVSLYYSVRLKDEYRNGNFTDTNNRTTLVNKGKTDDFPIPAIRDRSEMPTVKVGNQAYTQTGRFRILKVDENKTPLSGAYFTLTDSTGKEIMIQPSDKGGKIEVNNLPKGTYTLKEVEAPAGYVVSGLSWEIVVAENGKTTVTQKETGSRSAFSTRSAMPEAMGNLLEMGPMMGLAAVGAGAPAGSHYKISATTSFNDADPNNKKFDIHHEATGQTLQKDLDLYFLLVPESRGDLTLFNNRIRDYSRELANKGYQGYINVIYGGYDEASTQYTYWRIGNPPDLLTQVPIGRTTTGAWMDRALYMANDVLYRHLNEGTVKVVSFLSSGRNFAGEEAYYNENLQRMIESHGVSRYLNLVTNNSNKGNLEASLNDSSNPIPAELREEMKDKLVSETVSYENPTRFRESIDDVYRQFTVENTVNNESLVIPLAENIHLAGSPSAKIVNSQGDTLRAVSVSDSTDFSGMTTLRTNPITLASGERLILDYSVTLKGDYKRAISYPVYATDAVEWVGNGTSKKAGIKSAYVSDPGQNLNIEVKGLDGYSEPVNVTVATQRSGEGETFSLRNGESKVKTILTFDENGSTQGPNNIGITADQASNANYQGPKIDLSAYPVVRVVYDRKALNLTVRKVYNNRLPQAGESLDVTLIAKVNGQDLDLPSLKALGYQGSSLTQTLAPKNEGVYETIYRGLPFKDQNGNEIDYSVKDSSSSQDLGNNITLIREETITSYRPKDDLIRIEETEIPVLTVINTTNELKFKKVGESGQQKDEHGNPIVGPDGNPLMSETPLAEAEFELRRETPQGSVVVKGYEKVVSGPNGEFGFKNLPPGDYGIYETKPVLGYELPVQAVSTFTIGADGKPVPGSIKSFKERSKKDGDTILGIQKTMRNNVSVETAITQVEATDHNQGNRKMLYTQRIYINRNGERLTEANLGLFSATADNPIVNASYKIWKIPQGGPKPPARMDFNQSLDAYGSPFKEVKAPAKLSEIKLDSLPSTDFYIIEVKGELEVHDDKFTSKLTFFTSATEEHPGVDHQITDPKPSDNGTIITGFRKGQQGDDADIMSSATKDPGTGAYLVRNYRGSTFFSVQKTKKEDGKPLAGAKFKLWAALGRNFEIVETEHTTQVTTGAEEITDKNGIITFDNLPVNYNFYLEETETAPGFALPDYMWIVQVRPTSYLKELHAKSRDWHDYLSTSANEEEAKKQAAAIAYNQMLYPFGKGAPGSVEAATDKTAEEQGFKVFVYQTDGRKPLIIRPKDANGSDLPGNPVDPKTYVKDKYGDVIAEQSYGNHPKISGMWYRKGWVRFDEPKPLGDKGQMVPGQMMPINESGQPIHDKWKNEGWKGETIDGVSGATIRPLIVKDWIQQARDFDGWAGYDTFPTSDVYDKFVQEFNKHMVPAKDLTIEGAKIPSVVGITNSQTEFFINKVDQDGKPLEGAEFELFKVENGVELQPGIKPTRTAKNQFIFDGLKEGVYHLKETKTPEGYQEATTYWEITVNKEGSVTKKEEKPITLQAAGGKNRTPEAQANLHYWEGLAQEWGPVQVSPNRTFDPVGAGAYATEYQITYCMDGDRSSGNERVTWATGGETFAQAGLGLTANETDRYYRQRQFNAGYQFAGWQDLDGRWIRPDTIIDRHMYLMPQWTKPSNVTNKVHFFDENGDYIPGWSKDVAEGHSYNQDFGALPGQYPTEGKSGYEWRGWLILKYSPTVGNYYVAYTGKEPVNQVTYLYANWEKKPEQVVLSFYMLNENGKVDTSLTQTRAVQSGRGLTQAQIPPSNPPSKTGYEFSGWQVRDYQGNYVDIDLTQEVFTVDRAFYGRWIPKTYLVTFQNEKGEPIQSKQVRHGEFVTAPVIPPKEGYTFNGWKETTSGLTFNPSQPVTADATYKATWKKIPATQVSVSFDSQGGSPVRTQLINKGSRVTKPKDPTKEGFTFAGWLLNGQAFDFNQPVKESIVLTASWTEKPDPGTMNELIVKNLKKEFEGEFSIDKFQKLGENRVKLRGTYFSLTKREEAELPESFDPAAYAEQYFDKDHWDVDKGLFKTGKNGDLTFPHLQPGVYDLKEEISPDGYLVNPEKYVIVVNKIGNTIIVPESGYDPDKYPVEVDHGTEPTPDPDQPTKRTTPKSLDGELTVEDYKLKTSAEDGVIRPLKDQRFSMEYTIRLPEDAIPGDTFTITLDKHLNWGGIRIDPEKVQDIVTEHGQVVATTQDQTQDKNGSVVRKITYTLTDYVANRTDIVIHQTVPVYVDHNEVTNSTGLTFTNTIGGAAQTSESIWVDFRSYYGTGGYVDSDLNWPLGGKHQGYENYLGGWFYENRATKEIEHYYYVFGENISWSTEYTLNLEAKSWLRNTPSDVIYNDPNHPVKVSVYKVDAFTASGGPNTTAMPPSYGPRMMDLKDENRVMTDQPFVAGQDGIIRIPLNVNKDYPDGRFGYIVKAVAPFDRTKDQVDLYTYAKLSHKTNFYYRDFWNREYHVESRAGAATYWNYLHRYTGTTDVSGKDLVNMTLTKRELLGKEGEDKDKTKLIPGAGFKLTNNQGFQDYAVTGPDGTVKFTKLKPGNYFLEEVLTPKGYTPVNVVWDIHVGEDGTITISEPEASDLIQGGQNLLTVWNRKTPIDKPVLQFPNIPNRIEFTKVGESEAPLEGATFELRRSDTQTGPYTVLKGSLSGEKISGKDGKFVWTNLKPGYYQVWEKNAPEGYITPSKEVASFQVDSTTGEIKNLRINGRDPVGENMIRNLRPMKMGLRKIDEKKLDITKGKVTFAVKPAAGNNDHPVPDDLKTITIDLTKAGPYVREIPGSMEGKYILSEETPPNGYIKTTHQYEIEINQEKRTIRLTRVMDGDTEVSYLDKGLLSEAGPVILYQEGTSDQISLDIVNHLYYELPSTAGPGTFLFTLVGAFLLSLAISLLRKDDGRGGRPRKGLRRLRRQLE